MRLDSPSIDSFVNATHDHSSAAQGGGLKKTFAIKLLDDITSVGTGDGKYTFMIPIRHIVVNHLKAYSYLYCLRHDKTWCNLPFSTWTGMIPIQRNRSKESRQPVKQITYCYSYKRSGF